MSKSKKGFFYFSFFLFALFFSLAFASSTKAASYISQTTRDSFERHGTHEDYSFQISYNETYKPETPWILYATPNLDEYTFATAQELMNYLDSSRLNNGVYEDCRIQMYNAYYPELLSFTHGNYYLTGVGTESFAIKTVENMIVGGTEGSSMEFPSKGLSVSNNANLYIYDFELVAIEDLIIGEDSDLYVDNATINIANNIPTIYEGDNYHYSGNSISFGVSNGNNNIYIGNNSVFTSKILVFCIYQSVFDDKCRTERHYLETRLYGNLNIENSIFDEKSFDLENIYGNITYGENTYLNVDASATEIVRYNYGGVTYNAEPTYIYDLSKDNVLSSMKVIYSNTRETSFIKAFNFGDSAYTYEAYRYMGENEYLKRDSDGLFLMEGDTASLSKFTFIEEGVLNAYIDESDSNSLIAYTAIVDYEDHQALVQKYNFYFFRLQGSTYLVTTSDTYELHIPVGKSIAENYEGIEFSLDNEVELFYPKEHPEDYVTDRYEVKAGYFTDGTIYDFVPTFDDDWGTVRVDYKEYAVNFNIPSLKGATASGYFTRWHIGQSVELKTPQATISNEPSNLEWIFLGWSLSSDGEVIKYLDVTEENYKNITLYAVWNPVYTYDFYADGYYIGARHVEKGKTMTVPPYTAPTLEKHKFLYWYIEGNPDQEFDFSSHIMDSNEKIYAKYIRIYELTFTLNSQLDDVTWENDADGLFEDNTQTYYFDEDVVTENIAIVPSHIDYDFKGWFDSTDIGKNPFTFGTLLTKDVTLYPIWEIKKYTITFAHHSFDTETTNWPDNQIVNRNSFATKPTLTPGLNDYVFYRWVSSEDLNGMHEFNFNNPITKNITLYAYWLPYTYEITYHLETIGGITPSLNTESNSFDTHTTIEWLNLKLPQETDFLTLPESYALLGWVDNVNAPRSEASFTYKVKGTDYRSLTLYPVWARIWEVHFVSEEAFWWEKTEEDCYEDDTIEIIKEVVDGNLVSQLEYIPCRYTHEFVYWWESNGGENTPFNFETPITSDIYLYVHWEVYIRTLTFVNVHNATNWPANTTFESGTVPPQPTDPVLAHYDFQGWYRDEDLDTKYNFTSESVNSLTLYAKFTPTEYLVDYNLILPDSSSVSLKNSYDKFATIEMIGLPLQLPTVDNFANLPKKYVFHGWSLTAGGEIISDLYINNENFTQLKLHPSFTLRTVKIVYELDNTLETAWIIDNVDAFGVHKYFGEESIIDDKTKAVIIMDEETDSHTMIDVNDLFVTGADKFVSGWKRNNGTFDPGYVLTYQNVVNSCNSKDEFVIYPIWEDRPYMSFTNSEEGTNRIIDAEEQFTIHVSENEDNTMFIFEVNENGYELIAKAENRYITMDPKDLGLGKHNILSIFIWGQLDNFEEIDSYEDLLGIRKYKFETDITITHVEKEITEAIIPSFNYNGQSQTITTKDINIPGITIEANSYVDAGTYTFTASLDDKEFSMWSDGTVEDKTFDWTINKIEAFYKSLNVDVNYTYAPNTTFEITFDDLFYNEISEDSYTITGNMSATNAGTYSVTIEFTKNYTVFLNYEYTDSITFTWKVKRLANIFGPSIDLPFYALEYEFDASRIGEELFDLSYFYPNNYEQMADKVEVTGDTTYTAAGQYQVILSIKDKTNYEWLAQLDLGNDPIYGGASRPNPIGIEDVVIDYIITPKYLTVPNITFGSCDLRYLLNEYPVVPETINITDCNVEHNAYMRPIFIYDYDEDYIEMTGNLTNFDIGTYSLEITLKYPESSFWVPEVYFSTTYPVNHPVIINYTIEPGFNQANVYPTIENGELTLEFYNIENGDTIKYRNKTTNPNGEFTSSFTVVNGMNEIEFIVDFANPNYKNYEGSFVIHNDGSTINYGQVGDNNQDQPEGDQNNSNGEQPSNPDINNPEEPDDSETPSKEKGKMGCSKASNNDDSGLGSVIMMFSILISFVYIRKKLFN